MEDLVPLIFFLVIVLANGLKYLFEKNARKRAKEAPQEEGQPPRKPKSIEAFFEGLAEQVAPKPATVPDYVKEREAFEHAQAEEWAAEEDMETAAFIPLPEVEPPPQISKAAEPEAFTQAAGNTILTQSPLKTSTALLSGSREIRIPGLSPYVRIDASSRVEFSLKGKKKLKQAIIANIIFSPPRALDRSFDNTIAK